MTIAERREGATAACSARDLPIASGWSDLGGGLAEAGDIGITKRQWGTFYGTELDLQLRRRGIRTIVLGGIATNFGVEFDRAAGLGA